MTPEIENLHAFAKSYIDSVLAIHREAGEASSISRDAYNSAVNGAEDAFRALVEVRERRVLTPV